MTRRTALLAGGAVAAFAGFSAAGGRWLSGRFSAAASRAAVRLPAPAVPRPPLPAGASAPAAGVSPFGTPNRDFYRIDTALTVPQVQTQGYALRVTGMVDRTLELSYDDLLRRDLVEADITLTCVSNEVGGDLCGNARWTGVRLDELLAEAGVRPAADQVVGRSVDGYTCGFPVAAATDGRPALVALAMNGEPLPLEHGFPARLIVPGIYGYASATKWLTEIELTRFADFDHYWARRGYAVLAPIKTQARIDTPRPLARIAPGAAAIGGVAWAQTRGIRRVEVRIDDGPWQDAVLAEEVATTTWRQWHLPWDASPGRHTLTVRATDGTGVVQPEQRAKPLPDGASGWHQTVVFVQDGPT
jgi:DMSO/TMAO reductase YedYZ molybdopterin-dependent catalytic subunit